MIERSRVAWGLAATVLLAAAGAVRADVHTVYVFDFDYSIYRPGEGDVESLQILAGDVVRWEWLNDFHDVVSVEGQAEQWQSPLFLTGDSYEHTFSTPGVYWYYCSPHGFDNHDGTAGGMSSVVEVLPVPSAGTLALAAIGLVVAMPMRRRI